MIDVIWIDESLADHLYVFAGDLPEEATAIAFMAGGAFLADLQQDGVSVAIDKDAHHRLPMAAFFAFAPQTTTTTAEVNRPARALRFLKSLAIHPGHHEHVAGFGVLRDGGQQPIVAGEIGNVAHGRLLFVILRIIQPILPLQTDREQNALRCEANSPARPDWTLPGAQRDSCWHHSRRITKLADFICILNPPTFFPGADAVQDSLAILLPVHNAQATLTDSVARALEIAMELSPRCEIAIIDDGSTDGTEEIACDLALQYPQVLVARHHQPRGYDEAVHTGVQATHGSVLIIVPPTGELRAAELRQLWLTGIGHAASATNSDPASREPSTLVNRLMKWGQALREEQAAHREGPRMVRREMYRRRATRKFQPSRIDNKAPAVPTQAPNMLTQLRDFAFGE